MAKPWKKYLDAFKYAAKIAEGTNCAAPGTQPCCSDCGCSLAFKLRSLSSSCPKGHWPSVVFSDTTENQINQQIKSNDNSN